jgi:hypothetical protein
VNFRDFQSFLKQLSSPEALEHSRQLAKAYDDACGALLGPNDVQSEGGKDFKKKSAWRKLARHFFLSVQAVKEPHGRWERFPHDDAAHFVAMAEVEAVAPWGQSMPGFGACSTRELRFYSQGPQCPTCGGSMWDNRTDSRGPEDFACRNRRGCGGKIMPGEWEDSDLGLVPNKTARAKAEHDCLATAQTRAINRAVSELIAMGEVSWEEVQGGDEDVYSNGGGRTPGTDSHQAGKGTDSASRGVPETRGAGPNLGDVVAFGKHKGKTFREVCQNHPDDAWWFVRQAERVPQETKDMLEAHLNTLAEVGGQEAVTQPEPVDVEEVDPMVAVISSGKHEGKPWAEAVMADGDYFRKMLTSTWGAREMPEGSERRAGVNLLLEGKEPTDAALVWQWCEDVTGSTGLLDELAGFHPQLPDQVTAWKDEDWKRVLVTVRRRGWNEIREKLQANGNGPEEDPPGGGGTEGTPEPGAGTPSEPEPDPEPAVSGKMRTDMERTLNTAKRHQVDGVDDWETDMQKMAQEGDASGFMDGLDEMKSMILEQIGSGKSPVVDTGDGGQLDFDPGASHD